MKTPNKVINIHNNQKGAVLVWAVVVLLLLSILVGAVLTLSMAYYTRCVTNNEARQAYFTARSAADSIAAILCGANTTGSRDELLAKVPSDGSSYRLDNLKFNQYANTMGKCHADLKYENVSSSKTLLITAAATVGTQTKSLSLRLTQSEFSFPASDGDLEYVDYNETEQIAGNPNKNFYTRNSSSLKFLNNADYSGIIYAESGSVINISQGSKFQSSGAIYLQSGAEIQYRKLHNQFEGKFYAQNCAVITINGEKVTVIINPDNTVSFSPSGTGLSILSLFSVNDWNQSSGQSGSSSTNTQASAWTILQYEPDDTGSGS